MHLQYLNFTKEDTGIQTIQGRVETVSIFLLDEKI